MPSGMGKGFFVVSGCAQLMGSLGWLRIFPEPVMCAVEGVFEGRPSLHQS